MAEKTHTPFVNGSQVGRDSQNTAQTCACAINQGISLEKDVDFRLLLVEHVGVGFSVNPPVLGLYSYMVYFVGLLLCERADTIMLVNTVQDTLDKKQANKKARLRSRGK